MCDAEDGTKSSGEFVRIFDGVDPTEPYLLRDFLLQAGLDAVVRGHDRLTAMGDIPANSWPNVWVPPHQVHKARALVDEFLKPATPTVPWTCTHCGEECPGEFGSCWNCGADNPILKYTKPRSGALCNRSRDGTL